jgi:hypothetical protein
MPSLVARSSRGKLLELESVDHTQLLQPGPMLDLLVERIIAWQVEGGGIAGLDFIWWMMDCGNGSA